MELKDNGTPLRPIKWAGVRATNIENKPRWLGITHEEAYEKAIRAGYTENLEAGFEDSGRQWFDRVTAYYQAVLCGQIREDAHEPCLTSEMMIGASGYGNAWPSK